MLRPDAGLLNVRELFGVKMKLKKVKFDVSGFRNLTDLEIEISNRITVIAGHNGIGKSTILGLIANCSEFTKYKTLFNLAFRADFSEIFFLDYYKDFMEREHGPSRGFLTYEVEGVEVIKECTVTGSQKEKINTKKYKNFMVKVDPKTLTVKQADELTEDSLYVYRMRVIPRTKNQIKKEIIDKYNIGTAAKLKIPTIYLGMSRISPIGEFKKEDIEHKVSTISDANIKFIYDFFNSVIPFRTPKEKRVYFHAFDNNNKQSLVPEFGHSSLTISLGQDSLSSIATAIASFNNLKNTMGKDYPGGILVIDELEAGLHPIAQRNLVDLLKKQATLLNLQIVVTSHSLTIIKEVLKGLNSGQDGVVYLTDTSLPTVMPDPTYLKIKNDMLLEPFSFVEPQETPIPDMYVYFEDGEACDFMLGILSSLNITNTFTEFGRNLIFVPANLGCSNLLKLSSKSKHFIESIIMLDSDTTNDINKNSSDKERLLDRNNVILLPVSNNESIYNGFPPDKIAYYYLFEKYINYRDNVDFWRNKTPTWFTNDHYLNILYPIEQSGQPINIEDVCTLNKVSRKVMKKWYQKHYDTLQEINIFQLWAEENKVICQEFISILSEKIDTLVEQPSNTLKPQSMV